MSGFFIPQLLYPPIHNQIEKKKKPILSFSFFIIESLNSVKNTIAYLDPQFLITA